MSKFGFCFENSTLLMNLAYIIITYIHIQQLWHNIIIQIK